MTSEMLGRIWKAGGILFCVIAVVSITVAVNGNLVSVDGGTAYDVVKEEIPENRYAAKIESEKSVYDGDTISDVRVLIVSPDTPNGEVWPGVFKLDNDIYVDFNLRIAGIDTPEKRPKKAGRTEESLKKEKAAAKEARSFLVDMLAHTNGEFIVTNPQIGKYAGRYVADVWIDGVHAGRALIDNGHAKPYDGGTKPTWEWHTDAGIQEQ